jgi:N-acetylglutamate synthase-like GNAT family acetyltransferase
MRLYFDEHFERAKCDLFYETWIENSFRGFAKAVVAEEKGKPVGCVTCHLPAPQESQIGIMGVAKEWQGSGIGTKLVQHFLAWSIQQGASRAPKAETFARSGYISETVL